MCGRYSLTKTPKDELGRVGITDTTGMHPRFNISPGQQIATVINDPELNGRRSLRALEWGLIPPWTKDRDMGRRLINARAETINEKPSFRGAARHHRCLIPADGFYEWTKGAGQSKQPWYIHLKGGRPFFFAGLWESWDGPNGEAVDSCTIITTNPNPLVKKIHHRMPVILDGDGVEAWIDASITRVKPLEQFLCPFPESEMAAYPVSPRVNSPANDDDACIAKVT